jgi:branched-chain amino acid transport system ATP-binding protein
VVALQTVDLDVGYGGMAAVQRGLHLEVPTGTLLGIVGPNGAGKTTLLESLAGLLAVQRGRILFQGQDVTEHGAAKRRRLGIALVREGRRIFPSLSVEENLLVAHGALGEAKDSGSVLEQIYAAFPALRKRRALSGALLSGGEQQMLAIARATIVRPVVLMADEPFRGLAALVTEEVARTLHRMRQEGTSVVVAEESERALHELGVDELLRLS